ncbi:exopolysaccharide biosynthesis protein [Marinimicrobium sp. ABcell2]|uniref:exopolysaccharide biosynthesis protein n=1 Tax=Marinimicrobium sp. ABcell2 TaxID=3069751 RepID=UPI0027B0BE27|nr:exopolysaccharide biosynthesis protein [Marinimicrobium sp. ABcell2]MDQ2077868.1 exopolysaccharide biosynthesis protein [Marinimicrobium sp. ABcell2]
MAERINLTGVLDLMDEKAEGEKLTLGAIMDAFGSRGFGPLLLAAALIELLPSGGIPGVPTLVAIIVILFSSQLVLGRRTPWMPEKLRTKGFKRDKFNKAREKVKPVTRKLDVLIKPRLNFFVTPWAARVVGCICILMALTMPPLEIIPMAGYIPALAIALLAVGLSGHDGLIVLLGSLVGVAGLALSVYWLFF